MYTCTMRTRLKFSLLFSLFVSCVYGQNIGVGQWRVHFPYNNPRGFEIAEEQLYAWGEQGFFRYDMESGETKVLSKIDGFSEVGVSTMLYHESTKTLLVAYQNSVMDLLVNREELIQVPDIALANINGSKQINHMSSYQDFAILSCGFGIHVYNVKKQESTATWRSTMFTEVYASTILQNKVYAATKDGIYSASLPPVGMAINPASWTLIQNGEATMIANDGAQLWTVIDSVLYNSNGTTFNAQGGKKTYYKMVPKDNEIFLNSDSGLFILTQNGYTHRNADPARQVMVVNNKMYSASFGYGIIIDQGGPLLFISPSGPQGLRTGKMVSKGGKIYIGGGYMFERGAPSYSFDGYYTFENGKWSNSRSTFNDYLDTFKDIHAITLDPNGDLWLASLLDGIVRLRGNQVLEHYSPLNSPLKTETPLLITSIQLDDKRNLWVSNYESTYPLLVKTVGGVWDSISLGNATTILDMIITRDGNKWMKLRDKNSVVSAGIMVYNDNGTPLDQTDDPSPKYLGTGAGNGDLPSAEVRCMTEDRNGQLWIGTAKGLAVFYSPSNIFSNRPSDARQIVIGEGDNVGYLLGDEEINAIYVDGGNRKWIASRSGLWLVSPDGQEVLAHFNQDNSPLISNEISQLGMVEETGELFIATDKGIISYRTGSSAGGDTHGEVKVFPNPVKPDFEGPITISGLPQDAYVKITDISGNLIYETRANGGTATWNGQNFSGRRASTGVYMVFTANQDASDTYVSKILFIAP
ncbi:MAG: hypothetical protein EP332_11325 [Bacteroidetes bacterium]|nr:MAG: hypothetical protein EP332_11325 [Bacteroidota bacterium]